MQNPSSASPSVGRVADEVAAVAELEADRLATDRARALADLQQVERRARARSGSVLRDPSRRRRTAGACRCCSSPAGTNAAAIAVRRCARASPQSPSHAPLFVAPLRAWRRPVSAAPAPRCSPGRRARRPSGVGLRAGRRRRSGRLSLSRVRLVGVARVDQAVGGGERHRDTEDDQRDGDRRGGRESKGACDQQTCESATFLRSWRHGVRAYGGLCARRGVSRASPAALAQTYAGLGTWIDIFDDAAWENPEAAVRAMYRKGATILFLQSGSSRPGPAVHRPARTARFLRAAHERGMTVVAWYLAPYVDRAYETRRAIGAIQFETGRRALRRVRARHRDGGGVAPRCDPQPPAARRCRSGCATSPDRCIRSARSSRRPPASRCRTGRRGGRTSPTRISTGSTTRSCRWATTRTTRRPPAARTATRAATSACSDEETGDPRRPDPPHRRRGRCTRAPPRDGRSLVPPTATA